MTIGEKIKLYRKQLGLSQDELGQKLLVSRQTISLWEKDQTVPTIDNLSRLREIFGVSVDEILGFKAEEKTVDIFPNETYQMNFTKAELNELHSLQRKSLYKKPIVFSLLCIILFIIGLSYHIVVASYAVGMFVVGISYHIKSISSYIKVWKSKVDMISKTTYEYKLFEDYLDINLHRNNQLVRHFKCYYSEIEQIQQIGKWLIIQIGGQAFIVRKIDLKENSAIFSYMYKNPLKTKNIKSNNKWRVISIILFVASILTIYGALGVTAIVSNGNYFFIENMWLFFLLTPIPIASIVFGCYLKNKGYKYKKNIVVGIIMLLVLCIYGSFTFVFADTVSHSNEPIVKVEKIMGIDIPDYKQVSTQDWTKGTQSVTRGYIYYTSDVLFDSVKTDDFETRMMTDDKWLSFIPSALIGISSDFADFGYDYALIYNIDTEEFNSLPDHSGTYRFMNILYSLDSNTMKIVEYDIEYIN